jgi:hypothetical protein
MGKRFSRFEFALRTLRDADKPDDPNAVVNPPAGSALDRYMKRKAREIEYKGRTGQVKETKQAYLYPFGVKYVAVTIDQNVIQTKGSSRNVIYPFKITTQSDGKTNKGQSLTVPDNTLSGTLNLSPLSGDVKTGFPGRQQPARVILRVGTTSAKTKQRSEITGQVYYSRMQSTSLTLPFGRITGTTKEIAEVSADIRKNLPSVFVDRKVSVSFLPEILDI